MSARMRCRMRGFRNNCDVAPFFTVLLILTLRLRRVFIVLLIGLRTALRPPE